jgi:hypothetical protein
MKSLDRRAAISLLLAIPALSGQARSSEHAVNLDNFSMIINFGTSRMEIDGSEIWKALHPVPPSSLV